MSKVVETIQETAYIPIVTDDNNYAVAESETNRCPMRRRLILLFCL